MSSLRLILCLEAFLSCIITTQVVVESATISVALYNYIPDLNDDGLDSYKNLVESEFRKICNDKHDVVIVVDGEYDPYSSNLKKYLRTFDILEIDTVKLGELVNPEGSHDALVMSLDEMGLKGSIKEDMFPAAVEAMTQDKTIYGYPTLLCGNVVTSISPVTTEKCPINKGCGPLNEYKEALKICGNFFFPPHGSFETLMVGKMNDEDGWYLPYIYLDGYIDRYGKSSLTRAIKELEEGVIDNAVCTQLNWFVDLCQTRGKTENKCKDGSMSTSDIQDSIIHQKGVLMFSFSEKLAEVLKKCPTARKPQALASVPLDDHNYMLQFTDGVVVSKERWMAHEEDKRDAIKQFVKMFTSSTFRYKLAYGVDLNKPQVRYLLIPNRDFYRSPSPAAFDPIYVNAAKFLEEAVPAPALKDKSKVQELLKRKCLRSNKPEAKPQPKRKSEL